jgi:DNA-binding transcriptional MerR regulator
VKIDINININLDEIKELLSNCDEMRQFLTSNIKEMPSKVADIGENSEDEKPANKGLEHQVEVTMETVRAKLAALMQGGKQAEVKELLKKHGGDKLSDIPKENYPALLAEAEAM